MWEWVDNQGRNRVSFSCAETAKEIRKVLKEKYPAIKFSVRSDVYAGGASIRVAYDSDQAEAQDVKAMMRFFEGATFDGMIDLKSYKDPVNYHGKIVDWGSDYVFVDNEYEHRKRHAEYMARYAEVGAN